MGYRKIKLDCASVCSDARSRGQSCHCANLQLMLILPDKDSVLILCIIVVAIFFVQGSMWLFLILEVWVVSRQAWIFLHTQATMLEYGMWHFGILFFNPWPAMQWHAYKRSFAFLSGNLILLFLRLQYILNVFKFRSFVTFLSLSIAQKLTPENVLKLGVSILPPILSKRDET